MIKLKITVSNEIIQKAKYCGTIPVHEEIFPISKNCAIALAVRDIFPNAIVGSESIIVDSYLEFGSGRLIDLPEEAQQFIINFDMSTVEERMKMDELEFEVSIPDNVIDQIDISDLLKLIEHPNLELVN